MPAEIAVRQLSGLAKVLHENGTDLGAIVAELDMELPALDDVFARVDWSAYVRVLEAVRERCGAGALRRVGAGTVHTDDAYLFRANILLGFDDSQAALASMCEPRGLFRTIVPCIDVAWEATGPRTCRVRASMRPGYGDCPAHHELSAGTIAEFPRVLFERPARVTLVPTERGADYEVEFARPSPLAALRRRWHRSRRNRTFLQAVGGVFEELSQRQVHLQRESQLRAESEEKLRRTEKMEALGQLTGGVAHDFNNLLLVIRGNLDLLHNKLADGDQRRLLEAAEEAVQRGADLTKQLLAFNSQAPLAPETLDLNDTVVEMQTLLERTLGEQVSISTDLAPGLWQTNVDPGLLKNAVINLALNARDAMPDGGHLTIETANTDIDSQASRLRDVPPGAYVTLALSDTGIGMTDSVLDRAFDPFFTTKPVGKGSGLGLAMVYGFIEQSKGTVRIDSRPGVGTVVTLYLPRARERLDVRRAGPADEALRGSGETVLVVEDDPRVSSTVTRQLEELGYAALKAADAAAALEILSSRSDIRALLTDIVLPGPMAGPALADRALRQYPSLGVAYMSGYPDDATTGSSSIPASAVRLGKPFHRAELASAISRAVSRS